MAKVVVTVIAAIGSASVPVVPVAGTMIAAAMATYYMHPLQLFFIWRYHLLASFLHWRLLSVLQTNVRLDIWFACSVVFNSLKELTIVRKLLTLCDCHKYCCCCCSHCNSILVALPLGLETLEVVSVEASTWDNEDIALNGSMMTLRSGGFFTNRILCLRFAMPRWWASCFYRRILFQTVETP